MKLFDEICLEAKTKNVLVLFDMDGTIVEYGHNEKPFILKNHPGFYFNKQPLEIMISIAKELSKQNNITVGILSNCYFNEQKNDKLEWIEKFAPFIDKNQRHVIVYNNLSFKKEEKNYLKAIKIQTIQGFDRVYLIEDNHEIISVTNKVIPNTAHHLSRLLV